MVIEDMFRGLFDTESSSVIGVANFLLCILTSLGLGLLLALCYTYRTKYSKSFLLTVALLPTVVCVVILMVNGNLGVGVAVAGTFSLVRFRSAPGTAKEICTLFIAMGIGLIVGSGYLGFAGLFTLILCIILMIYCRLDFGENKRNEIYRTLNITIPEDLDYSDVFTDIFKEYTESCELIRVKTTNMGSMFRLTYDIKLLDPNLEKSFIDKLRARNGNLEISVSKRDTVAHEL